MSVDGAIKLAEKAAADLAAKKEADRIAKLKPEEIKAEQDKAEASKKAADDKVFLETPEEKLDEAGKKRRAEIAEAEKKRVADEETRILKAKDDELSDDERSKKTELLKQAQDRRAVEKDEAIQKRIDEIAGELKAEKALRAKDQEKIAALEAEQKKLKGISDRPAIDAQVKQLEQDRVKKLVEEDKALARENRREMTKAELDDWMIEDMTAANEWLADRAVRRDKDRSADVAKLSKPVVSDEVKAKAEAIVLKQRDSRARAEQKHPDLMKKLNIADRVKELKAEGKNANEVNAILFEERPETRIVAEILREDEDTYLLAEDGPEKLADEVSKRLGKATKRETQDERDTRIAKEAVDAELARQASLPENLRSNGGHKTEPKLSEEVKGQYALYQKNFPGKTFDDFKKMKARRGEPVA